MSYLFSKMLDHAARTASVIATLLLLLPLFLIGCSDGEELSGGQTEISGVTADSLVANDSKPAPVVTARVTVGAVEYLQSYSETCRGVQEAKLSAHRPGKIVAINKSLGDNVSRGESILQLDDELERLAVASAIADVELFQAAEDKAKVDLERAERLHRDSLVSESRLEVARIELRKATAGVKAAEASLGLAEKNLRETKILSPITGELTALPYELGETPTPATLVAEVVDRSALLVDIFLPEQDLAKIRIGQRAVVSSPLFPGRKFNASVRSLSPKAEERSKLFHAEVIVENPDLALRSGLTISMALAAPAESQMILVPLSALVEREGATYAALALDDTARFRKVVTGERFDANIEIKSGLESGDILIVIGAAGLGDGASVEVVEEVPLDSLLN